MNHKDLYDYYIKKVYNEDLSGIKLVADVAGHFIAKGATDIASGYHGTEWGDPTKNDYKKRRELKSDKQKQEVNIKNFLTTKFTTISAIPYSIKNRAIRFLKYIILEYVLTSNDYINKENTNTSQDYIFESSDGLGLFNELDDTSLNKFIINKTPKTVYVGTKRISDEFSKVELTEILQKVNTNENVFIKNINNILKPTGGILKEGFNYDELRKVYEESGLDNLIFTSQQLEKDKR